MKPKLACCTLALSGLLSMSPSAVALEPVGNLNWCPGSVDCLSWSPSPGATHYNLYRGGPSGLPAVIDGGTDSCTVGTYTDPTSGTFAAGSPAAGVLQWYLVGAVDDLGAENAGDATSGARSVDSSGSCEAAVTLVLNEVDYDQAGSDQAEYVELFNPGPAAVDLDGLVLITVNGSTQAEYDRVALSDAGPSLAAGAFLVVGAPGVQGSLPPGTAFAAFESSNNNVQNGAPDGLALFDTTTAALLDALSYEGSIVAATFDDAAGTFDLVEGEPTSIADSNTTDGSLCRLTNGQDTDDAASDWLFCTILTPGGVNVMPLE